MISKVTLTLLLLAGLAMAAPDNRPTSYDDDSYESESYESESYESGEAKYDFSWSVEDDSGSYENRYGHQESRDGDQTQGSYYVLLPDGRLKTVNYYVDGYSGFVASVEYDGSAEYESGSNSYESGSNSYESNESDDRYYKK